ncbi:hypothetical protein ACFL0Q_02240 [Thermodesulfobacteriota bacterium]
MELQLPGVDELERRHNLRDKAASAAEEGAIRSQDTAFDDGQQSIVQELRNLESAGRSIASGNLERHQRRRGEIAAELESLPRQEFPKAVQGAVELVLRGCEEKLKKTQGGAVKSLRALKAYCLRSGITRPPRYPEWRVLHWAIVFVLFFGESVANSQFFAKASPFGLIGGWLQASIISATNIGLGLMGGMAVLPWRNSWEVRGKSTKVPTAVAVMIGFFLFLFNLATAHYRVLLEEIPKQAIKLAIDHLWSAPLSINNFDAWVLLFVGIIFATVAWIEGYKSDDPLREYGHLSRRYEKRRDENAGQKTSIRSDAVAQLKKKKDELVSAARQSKILLADYSAQINRSKADASEYREWRNRIEEVTRTLLLRYRSYYLQVHEIDPEPSYFSNEYSFPEDTPFLEEEERIKSAEDRLDEFKRIVEELETIRDSGIENEAEIISQVQKTVDDFVAKIEGVAKKETDEEEADPTVRP